ncbi:hypothetical protein IAT38_004723 [Cryptococcus sp. DSM 104549]
MPAASSRPAKRARVNKAGQASRPSRPSGSGSGSETELGAGSAVPLDPRLADLPIPWIDKDKGRAQGALESDDEMDEDGEDRAEEEGEEEDEGDDGRRRARSARAKRAWTTRRVRRAAGLSRAEEYIHIPDPPPRPPPLSTPLPTSDLLQSIHHHASTFYTAHGMLSEPARGRRKVGWGSRKRLELIRDAEVVQAGGSRAGSLAGSRDGSASRQGTPQETQERELVPASSQPASPSQAGDEGDGVQKRGARGSYKTRDMYRAIQGEGLMALGVLVQEHVVRQLYDMGYRVRNGEEEEDVPSGDGKDDDDGEDA